MAGETQEASIGYAGEVWVDNASGVPYELRQVVSFALPARTSNEVDATHLKSPDFSQESIPGLGSARTIAIVLNHRPLSDTDLLCREWVESKAIRDVKLVIPKSGLPYAQTTFTAQATGYDPGTVEANGKMQSTLTITLKSAENYGAYAA